MNPIDRVKKKDLSQLACNGIRYIIWPDIA